MEGKMGSEPRPRIGVTWVTRGHKKSDNYIEAVRRAGAEPVVLGEDPASWDGQLDRIDGLLLTGGGDIDPTLYGQQDSGKCELVKRTRDDLELGALRLCRERGLPVLGICRGFQLINVALGGSLMQDLATNCPGALAHRSDEQARSRYHSIRVLPDTALAAILGHNGEMQVNSRHHQGLTEGGIAPGLRVSAVAPDGIIEGIELDGDAFLVAVQCHPERPGEAPVMEPVFTALVERARRM
jgi:putative glutamine amidotransferase